MRSVNCKQILVVEDHFESAELLRMILEEEGYLVQIAETGAEAIQKIAAASMTDSEDFYPDLILLDLRLPDMSGVEVVTALQKQYAVVPPVVLLSADPQQYLNDAANSLGTSAVRKPFDFDELFQSIRIALKTHHTADALIETK